MTNHTRRSSLFNINKFQLKATKNMHDVTKLSCRCGKVSLKLDGPPFMAVECCCNSCREAGERFLSLSPTASTFAENGTVPFVMQRNDRVSIVSGQKHLAIHRLGDKATTSRVLATCCKTPIYLQMRGGHWVSLYGTLWPEGRRPAPEMRTLTVDCPDNMSLSSNIPNLRTHSLSFYWRLFKPWVRMGFRNRGLRIERTIDA